MTAPNDPKQAITGLTESEVIESRKKYGDNSLAPVERDPWWKQLLEKFSDPLIQILLLAAGISLIPALLVPGHSCLESVGILSAVLLATFVSFINEYKANKEFDVLNQVNDVIPVRVLRDGHYTQVPKTDLVVGDIVLLEVGEEIPADGQVIEAVSFQVNQASLTGESESVHKHPHLESDELPGAYASNVVLRSTLVTDGHAVIEVTKVGQNTEIGKVAQASTEETENETPLQQQLSQLSKGINVVGSSIATCLFVALVVRDVLRGEMILTDGQWGFVAVCAVSVIILLAKVWLPILRDAREMMGKSFRIPTCLQSGKSWFALLLIAVGIFGIGTYSLVGLDIIGSSPSEWMPGLAAQNFLAYFMVAITLIVVSVPEGLPMSVTLSLAYSMRKMTKQNNLVRKMHACETIGAATVVCSDKTGTLTMNKMVVKNHSIPEIDNQGKNAPLFKIISEAIAVNSTANLSIEGDRIEVLGNATEGALLKWLHDQQCDYLALRNGFKTIAQLTFSTERKFMATSGKSGTLNEEILYVKGAPEVVLSRCTQIVSSNGSDELLQESNRAGILDEIAQYQRKAMRVLGLAYKPMPSLDEEADLFEDSQDLVWIGYFAIQDPVRPDVPAAIRSCQDAGVAVKIVTGDNKETACQIGREIGLFPESGDIPKGQILTGAEFEAMSDEELKACITDMKVLSRARPMDKQRLVKTLQSLHNVVAVTGDGTNDAPALNYADVGLSMGQTGTSVAKEASDIVLLDDSFTSIVSAIKWGRSLYRNIQKFIVFQLTVNLAACGIAFLGPFIGINLPLTVTQMLWVNLIMDTFAALALATEPPSDEVMKQKPRNKLAFIITPSMFKWIASMGIAFIIAIIWYIRAIDGDGNGISLYHSSMLFSGFVLLQFWNLFNARVFGTNHSFLHGITKNPWFIGILAIILIGQWGAVQWGGGVFRTQPLTWSDWGLLLAITAPVLLIGEISRWISRLKAK